MKTLSRFAMNGSFFFIHILFSIIITFLGKRDANWSAKMVYKYIYTDIISNKINTICKKKSNNNSNNY